jgi:hypothetical protein
LHQRDLLATLVLGSMGRGHVLKHACYTQRLAVFVAQYATACAHPDHAIAALHAMRGAPRAFAASHGASQIGTHARAIILGNHGHHGVDAAVERRALDAEDLEHAIRPGNAAADEIVRPRSEVGGCQRDVFQCPYGLRHQAPRFESTMITKAAGFGSEKC